jgi:hypothetical protein
LNSGMPNPLNSFSKRTARGSACTAIEVQALRDIVERFQSGFQFGFCSE